MTVNDPMFTTLTLVRHSGLRRCAVTLYLLLTVVLGQCIDPVFKGQAVQEDYPEQVEACHVRGGVDSDWSSGTECEPVSLERGGKKKQRKNRYTSVTPEKSE